jgi:L-xylulokinase
MENEKLPEEKNIYSHISYLVESVDANESDVYYLPFLYGSNAHPLAKGSFIGLTSFHNKAHMIRAIFEGVCFSAKSHIDKLLSVRESPKAIRLAGGVVNSKVWVQMFADVLNIPIETVDNVKELGALGCAMSAFIVAGIYKDYPEAAAKMVRINPLVHPNLEKAKIYQEKYGKFTAVSKALDTIWDKFEV